MYANISIKESFEICSSMIKMSLLATLIRKDFEDI